MIQRGQFQKLGFFIYKNENFGQWLSVGLNQIPAGHLFCDGVKVGDVAQFVRGDHAAVSAMPGNFKALFVQIQIIRPGLEFLIGDGQF